MGPRRWDAGCVPMTLDVAEPVHSGQILAHDSVWTLMERARAGQQNDRIFNVSPAFLAVSITLPASARVYLIVSLVALGQVTMLLQVDLKDPAAASPECYQKGRIAPGRDGV